MYAAGPSGSTVWDAVELEATMKLSAVGVEVSFRKIPQVTGLCCVFVHSAVNKKHRPCASHFRYHGVVLEINTLALS